MPRCRIFLLIAAAAATLLLSSFLSLLRHAQRHAIIAGAAIDVAVFVADKASRHAI